ncbi:S8 family peptidase [Actinomadura rayongensis]|uniref:S8 family serine peptidase n=1 Tax=Actinomadura rayongensis TaxID=1429076 RepID=A0A6I4WJG5_9ACTN|nr:S8 family peptidase [Actinomadura rayongensis]MXQ67836.1 S8 family serine peptidase [Actinomadura rayongensis]
MHAPRLAGCAIAAAGALVLPLVTVSPAVAEGPIVNAQAARPVKGSYIVTLKDTPALRRDGVGGRAQQLTHAYSGRVGFVYSSAVTGFQAHLSAEKARRLAADPAVASVEQDAISSASDVQPNPPSWGLDRADQKRLPLDHGYSYGTKASNVTAYIIDTGLSTSHADFGGRASSGYDFVDNDTDANDCNGHGTHVAGTVGGAAYGIAKGVKLVGVRVLGCDGRGANSGIIKAIDWVAAHAAKPAVANMSLGGSASPALDAAVERAVTAGITFAVAAGNDNANACNTSPARARGALTVGATTSTDARASFSNYGSCLDLFAPGYQITSTWIGGRTATATLSGTSMATPHVTGAAALVLAAHPGYSPEQVGSALTSAATTGVVGNPGSGSANRLLFTGGGTPASPGPAPTPTPPSQPSDGDWWTQFWNWLIGLNKRAF